jgi:lipopolysaccharide export LptBFGC system permease protein LptF
MPATITPNWRVLRPLLLLIAALSFILYYLYLSYRPPTSLYTDLFVSEAEGSKKLIHNEIGNKYVKFKQLQGAGFNNQVRKA